MGLVRLGMMKFTNAQCVLCLRDIFDEKEMATFTRPVSRPDSNWTMERFDIEDQQPWCGVTCICLDCVNTVAEQASYAS